MQKPRRTKVVTIDLDEADRVREAIRGSGGNPVLIEEALLRHHDMIVDEPDRDSRE